jgi:hypothetical protein
MKQYPGIGMTLDKTEKPLLTRVENFSVEFGGKDYREIPFVRQARNNHNIYGISLGWQKTNDLKP